MIDNEWNEVPTVVLTPFRVLPMGDNDLLIHVTPTGYHVVDECRNGRCLVCHQPLEGFASDARPVR